MRDVYPTARCLPHLSCWNRIASNVKFDALVSSSNCLSGFGAMIFGSSVTLAISWSRALRHSCVHSKGIPFFISRVSGCAISAKFWINGL